MTTKEKLLYILEERFVKDNTYLLKDSEYNFMKQRIILATACGVLMSAITFFLNSRYCLVVGMITLCVIYKFPLYLLMKYKKQRQNQVNGAFLIWILQLEALVLSNNISNSIKKSIRYCPGVLQEEVRVLSKKVEKEPTNKNHYLDFAPHYQTMDMNEVMLSLYQFNFAKKEDLAYDFALIHHRIDKLKLYEQETNYRIQSDNWGLILMCCPILGMIWSMFFCIQLNEIIFNMI